MSLVMRKPEFCICENKGADQLCVNRTTDQRLCFRYMDSTIPLLSKSEISSLGNPEDRFPHDAANMSLVLKNPVFGVTDQV